MKVRHGRKACLTTDGNVLASFYCISEGHKSAFVIKMDVLGKKPGMWMVYSHEVAPVIFSPPGICAIIFIILN